MGAATMATKHVIITHLQGVMSFTAITACQFFVALRGRMTILLAVPAEFGFIDEGVYSRVRTFAGDGDAFRKSFFIESDEVSSCVLILV